MSPPKKKKKKEEVPRKWLPNNDPNSGVIRIEIDKPLEMDEDGAAEYSEKIEVGGMPWRVSICRNEFKPEIDWEAEVEEEENFYYIYLHNIHEQLTPWLVEATVEYAIVSDKTEPEEELESLTFSRKDKKVMVIDEYQIPEHLEDDKLIVEIRFTITNKKGFRTATEIDFTDSTDPRHDVALVFNGEKIYVSKAILALHSPVFNAMLYGNFDEKDKKEIELPDVDREEFIELLHVIYPSCKIVTENTAEYILKLADRFQIEYAIECAEAFLVNSMFVSKQEKLRLADEYRLFLLKYDLFSGFKTKQDFKNVEAWSVYRNLSDATKAEISEKIANCRY